MERRMHEPVKNVDLLNPDFNGYKLAGANIGIATWQLPTPVRTAQLSSAQSIVFAHLRATGLLNRLVSNPWQHLVAPHQALFYIDSECRIMRLLAQAPNLPPEPVASLHPAAPPPSDCDPSLVFASADVAVASDGLGTLVVFHCGGGGTGDWVAVHQSAPQADSHFQVVAARSQPNMGVACVLRVLVDDVAARITWVHLVHMQLQWVPASNTLMVVRQQEWRSRIVPEFVSLSIDGENMIVVATQEFEPLFQPPVPAAASADAASAMDTTRDDRESAAPAPFVWSQQGRDIDVSVSVPPGTTSRDVDCQFHPNTLRSGRNREEEEEGEEEEEEGKGDGKGK